MQKLPPLSATHFSTTIGSMAIAWVTPASGQAQIFAIQLPERNITALLSALREKTQSPALKWTSTKVPPHIHQLIRNMQNHLAGDAQKFSLEHFYLDRISPFHRKVYERAVKIPSGKLLTYQQLAEKSGSPKASRAVGQAMAKNPFPIVVPCHRIISSSGPGGFSAEGGLHTKEKILRIENTSLTI